MLPNLTLRLPQLRRVQKQISDLIYLESGVPEQEVTIAEPTGEEYLFTVGLDKLRSLITLSHRIPILSTRNSLGLYTDGIDNKLLHKIQADGNSYSFINSNIKFDLLLHNDQCAIFIPSSPKQNIDIMYKGYPLKQYVPNQNLNLADQEFKVEGTTGLYSWKHFYEYSTLLNVSKHLAHIGKTRKTISFPYMDLIPASISYVFSLPAFNGNTVFLKEVNKILNNIVDSYSLAIPLKCKDFSTITTLEAMKNNIHARLIPLLKKVLPTVSLEDYIDKVRLVEPLDLTTQHYSEKIFKARFLGHVTPNISLNDLYSPKDKNISKYWTLERAMTTFDSLFTFKKHNQFHIDFMNLLVYGLKLVQSNSSCSIENILNDPGYYNAFNMSLNDGTPMRFSCISIKISKKLYEDIVKRVPASEIDKPIFYSPPPAITAQTPAETDLEALASTLGEVVQDKTV
jgi:hypothetical protein